MTPKSKCSSLVRVLGLGLALLSPISCVSKGAYVGVLNKNEGLTRTLEQYDRYLKDLEKENESLRKRARAGEVLDQDLKELQEKKKRLQALLDKFESLGGSSKMPDIKVISNAKGEVGFRIQGEVLFPSGRAVISPSGKKTLAQVIPLLRESGKTIRIDGYTDNDPIRKSSWKSNLHLSVGRALAVAELFRAKGIPFDRLVIRGYGPNKPVTLSPSSKGKNRRVEIYLQAK
jgi:flagellar motor protein MotB